VLGYAISIDAKGFNIPRITLHTRCLRVPELCETLGLYDGVLAPQVANYRHMRDVTAFNGSLLLETALNQHQYIMEYAKAVHGHCVD